MMKSFFKKLASVLALAMVVSLAAPAAQTAAAAEAKEFTYKYQTGIGADVKTVNLAKTGDTVDLKFVGIPDFKDYKTQWMSYGTGFELDQSGVITATADEGEGVVWLSVGDDQTYISDPIKVTIGELTATIGTQDKSNKALEGVTLKVEDKMDLAFYGITDWNLGKYGYKWVVGDTSVLDVDQKTGEITALKAGETTVTFLAPNKFNQANVVVTNALKVTVVPAVEPAIDAVQKTQNNFEILFTDLTAANYNDSNIEVVRIFPADKDVDGNGVIDKYDEAEEEFFVKPVSVDKDNNKIVANTYADFVDGAVYEVRVGDYKDRFTASVGEVATISLTATSGLIASDGVAATPAKLSVKLYDKNGIDVTTVEVKGIKNVDNIVYELKGADSALVYLNGNEVTFVEPGVVSAYAYFDYYNITERVESNECKVYGSKHDDYVAKVIAWTVVDETSDAKINWNDVVKNNAQLKVASGDVDYHVVALLEDSRGNYFTTHDKGATATTYIKYNNKDVYMMDYVDQAIGHSFVFAANGYYVEFETLNPDNLLMYADGEVVTYKETTSSIKLNLYNVYNPGFEEEIAAVPLQVTAPRYVKYLTTSSSSISAVTDTEEDRFDSFFTKPEVEIAVYDQYNTLWEGAGVYTVSLVNDSTYTQAEKDALNAYIAGLTIAGGNKFKIKFDTKAIREALNDSYTGASNGSFSNRTAVSFKISEALSGRFVTVKVNLQVPNYEGVVTLPNGKEIQDELSGVVKMDTNRANNMTVVDSYETWLTTVDERAFKDWAGVYHVDRAAKVELFTTSKSLNVGYIDTELFVANEAVNALYDTNYPGIAVGDKMLIVTGPDNKVVPSIAVGAIDVTTGATNGALGVEVKPGTDDLGGTFYTYRVNAANANADGSMAYLRTGRYTVQVRTVIDIATNGKISLATTSATQTTNVKYFTITNTNANIALAGQETRDLRESADTIEEVVADAFNFNYVDGSNVTSWAGMLADGRDTLEGLIANVDYRIGDGYVYINRVTFRVPVDGKTVTGPYYYRTVNVGSSVKVSTDLFFFD